MTPLPHKVVYSNNPSYPENLRQVSGCPKRLYIAGEVGEKDKKAVAIIGSRKMTDYGKKIAWEFSFALAKNGITIVSGLARGVDTIAHKAALFAEGRTVAVLGSGIDVIYPPENWLLAKAIADSGAIVTEFELGTPPYAKNFLSRNRIISGLSLATLVIEGAARSGTLSTVSHTANEGKEVFAVPGSEATDWLIEQGANSVKSPEELINELSHSRITH